MIYTLIQSVVFIAACIILVETIVRLNVMSHKTNHLIRTSITCIAVVAFAEMFIILSGGSASWIESTFLIGYAILCVFDRRTRIVCPFSNQKVKE